MRRKPLFSPLTGIRPINSNTRVTLPGQSAADSIQPKPAAVRPVVPGQNLGLTSERSRLRMVERLKASGIEDEDVLNAMAKVPRHMFVDEALASRAYEDAALPIGFGQTISQPWVVAHMLSHLRRSGRYAKVLEVGTGCGYQAAVLGMLYRQVYSIERVRPLYDTAKDRLAALGLRNVHLLYGDGMQGWKTQAPFDAIVVAAAGIQIPQALLDQLAVGGYLIAPQGHVQQRLVLVVRQDTQRWIKHELEAVRFVPLKPGVQT